MLQNSIIDLAICVYININTAFERKINANNSLFDCTISHPNPFLFGDLYRCRMLTCGEYLILKGSAFVLEDYFIHVFVLK